MSERCITFEIPGPPKPKDRPRFSGHAYTTKATKDYEHVVTLSALAALVQHPGWDTSGRFGIRVTFFMGDKRKRDLDNCLKSVTDALNKLLYKDDSQLDAISAYREYDKERPRSAVSVYRLGEVE